MSGEILANGLVVAMDRAMLMEGVDDYCSCRLFALGSVAPVAGSRMHDGELGSMLRSSLESYGQVVLALGQAFEDACESIAGVDSRSARALGAG